VLLANVVVCWCLVGVCVRLIGCQAIPGRGVSHQGFFCVYLCFAWRQIWTETTDERSLCLLLLGSQRHLTSELQALITLPEASHQ